MLETFDRVYCIHLPNPERRKAMTAEFERVGLKDVQYIYAKPPPSGFSMTNMRRAPGPEYGVALSHLAALAQAIIDGARTPLFVEDDIVFHDRSVESPPEWDVLFLGGHPREKLTRVSESWFKARTWSCAEAYSIRRPAEFWQFWCNHAAQPDAMFDFVLGAFAATQRAFCVYPVLTEQQPNVSQVSGKFDDKRALIARGWANNLP